MNRVVSGLRDVRKDTREGAQIGTWHTALSNQVLLLASLSRFGVIICTVFANLESLPNCSRMSSTTKSRTLRVLARRGSSPRAHARRGIRGTRALAGGVRIQG